MGNRRGTVNMRTYPGKKLGFKPGWQLGGGGGTGISGFSGGKALSRGAVGGKAVGELILSGIQLGTGRTGGLAGLPKPSKAVGFVGRSGTWDKGGATVENFDVTTSHKF